MSGPMGAGRTYSVSDHLTRSSYGCQTNLFVKHQFYRIHVFLGYYRFSFSEWKLCFRMIMGRYSFVPRKGKIRFQTGVLGGSFPVSGGTTGRASAEASRSGGSDWPLATARSPSITWA